MKSEKDIAELAMITDLIRNDMTPLCEPRSVKVTNERRFIELPYAVQAVSDVEGTLLSDISIGEILKGLHPCGSVTGAPKFTALQLIKQLEPTPRKYYCGSLGFVSGHNAMFSILIRTAYRTGDDWIYGAGGGIVWDSDAQLELEEARLKMDILK
jgi:para-aminobenzoate synthetase / 4-amino-4-deoxychorismate lyase